MRGLSGPDVAALLLLTERSFPECESPPNSRSPLLKLALLVVVVLLLFDGLL